MKVRQLEGELEGLEEFVPAVQLGCRWKDWAKVQKDEQREQRMIEFLDETEPLEDVVIDAAEEVFDASREKVFIEHRRRGYTRWIDEPALERFAARAGIGGEPWRKQPAFKNRDGVWFIPDFVLVDLAFAFAAAEPETVHLHLDVEEQKLLRDGYWLDELEAQRRLLRSKPAFAVARSWAGGAETIGTFVRSSSDVSTCCERLFTICERRRGSEGARPRAGTWRMSRFGSSSCPVNQRCSSSVHCGGRVAYLASGSNDC